MSKNDMKDRVCALSKNDLKDLVKTYHIPLDLHPHLPDPEFTIDRLLADAIGIYFEFLWFSCVCVPFSTFLLSVLKYFKRLFTRLICLREMRDEVLVRSGLKMSIYDFMILPSWSDAKITEESHHLFLSLLERGSSYTTMPATKGAIISLPTPRKLQKRDLEACSSALKLDQAEGTDEADLADLYVEIEDSLERDECVSTRAVSAPTPRLGKRLGAPPSIAVVSASEPSHVGTSAPASTYGRSLSLGGSALARDAEYDQIPDDDFDTATCGEEINLTLKALDRTITPAKLRRTKYLLPLELSNRVNVLSALLVSHGYELNFCYANLVLSKAHLQKKFDKKKEDVKLLCAKMDAASKEQALTVRDLHNELVLKKSKSQGYNDAIDGLREEVTQCVGSGMESLVRKLLSSDEFHGALVRVASFGINYDVEKGLRMGRTDVEFEAVVHKVSNFHVGVKADFDKALVDFPTTPFPFLSKIVVASEGTLFDVAQLLPDKFIRSTTSVFVAPSSVNEAPKQLFIRELTWEGEDFVLPPFHWRTYVFLFCAPGVAYCFIRRFNFILSASSFSSSDHWIVLLVRMPISAGMTALVPYSRLNGVSPLLVLGVVLWPQKTFSNSFTHAPPSQCSLVLIPCIMLRLALSTALIPYSIYSWIGVIKVLVASSMIALTSIEISEHLSFYRASWGVFDAIGFVQIKSLLDVVGITAAHVLVNTVQLELMLLVYFNEKYSKLTTTEENILSEDMDQDSAHMVAASKVFMLKPVNTTNEVSTASTQVNAAFSTNIDNVSDVVICAFVASQANSPQLAHEDLEQIHLDDMQEIDLRWKMSMLTMRARRFLKKTRRKLTVNGNETLSFDMFKVECYNFHKRRHFARECRALRNQDNKHKESTRKSVPVETPASTALVSYDGLGEYDWSDQAEEGPNYALMAYTSSSSDSKVSNDSTCSKSCLKTVKLLKSQNEQLSRELRKSELLVLDEFANKPIAKNNKSSEEETKVARKNYDAPIIEEWVSDDEEENVTQHYKEIDGGYVAFGGNPKGGKITEKEPPNLSFMRPFRCPVTILSTIDHLGKFNGKADEGFFIGYSLNNKAFRVFNSRTKIVEENLNISFSENTPNMVGSGPDWLFDIDALTRTMNYKPIVAGTQSNNYADVKSTNRTRRPQPRNNPNSDKVPFKSKSSCLSNKLEKIEENHRSLQSSNYPDHTSFKCNNIKLAIRNDKSKVVYAMCLSAIMMSLIRNMKYEHGVVN
nr:ribonuclease H-like domain-containing protein [Tanacetum cinerariifolium]